MKTKEEALNRIEELRQLEEGWCKAYVRYSLPPKPEDIEMATKIMEMWAEYENRPNCIMEPDPSGEIEFYFKENGREAYLGTNMDGANDHPMGSYFDVALMIEVDGRIKLTGFSDDTLPFNKENLFRLFDWVMGADWPFDEEQKESWQAVSEDVP